MDLNDIADAADEIIRRNLNPLPVYTPADPLTKENFWNKLYADYPAGMKVFCDWIDEYKKAVKWGILFWSKPLTSYTAPKYHDLPFAMQIGIWFEFLVWLQSHSQYKEADVTLIEHSPILLDWKSNIEYVIAELQCIKDRDNEL